MIHIVEVVDMNGIEKGMVSIDEAAIRDKIKVLLELAYEELDKPKYDGYPTSDHVACFLDAEEILRSEFNNIFNDAVPNNYKDSLEEFKKNMIELRLDVVLDSLSQLEDSKKTNFDYFSKEHGVICNMALASTLLTVYTYASRNPGWMTAKKRMLKESTELLLKTYISGKGWQYYFIKGEQKHVHTCSTWLSLLALTYVPKEILTNDLKTKIEEVKKEVEGWLIEVVREEDKYYPWCFRPEEFGDSEYGENTSDPVATAQAILALYRTGMGINDDTIKYSIEFIKQKKTSVKNLTVDEIPIKRINQKFQGIQHCLHALLLFGIPSEDETVQYFLEKVIGTEKTIGIVDRIHSKQRRNRTEVERTSYYTTLFPILFYLYPPTHYKEPVLLDSIGFKNGFKSFITGANSIIIIGGIDGVYARLLPTHAYVRFLYRDEQEDTVVEFFESRGWECNCISIACGLENINCVIVDARTAILSSNLFGKRNRYGFFKYLEGDEVSDLIKHLEEITGISGE